MLVDYAALIDAVKLIDMVPAAAGLPSSEFLKISSYDKNHRLYLQVSRGVAGCVSVPYELEQDAPFAINTTLNRALFMAFVSVEKGSDQKFGMTWLEKDGAKSLRVVHGRRKADFAVAPPQASYGERGTVRDPELLSKSKDLIGMVRKAVPFASNQASEGLLNCVLADQGVMAINQVSAIRLGRKTKFRRVPVPLEFATLWTMVAERDWKVAISKNEIQLSLAGTSWFRQGLHAEALANYPDQELTKFIKTHESLAPVASIRRSSLVNVAARYGGYFSVAIDKEKVVHFQLAPGTTQARFRAQIQGSQFDEPVFLTAKPPIDVPTEYLFDVEHFLPFVAALDKSLDAPVEVKAPPNKSYIFYDELTEFMLARR